VAPVPIGVEQRAGLALRAWWMEEMLSTPSPLTERMTLFWHNHFVSGQPKVRISRLMYRQNVLLRAHATGNFGTLLHAIGKDPAMLVYLDSAQNRKGAPNENFAREVMELFTLGEGHYTEQDVKEAARAFTGWSLDRETLAFVFRSRAHDDGTKTVLARAELRRRRRARLLLARPDRAIRDREAVARIRFADPIRRKWRASPPASANQLRHQGGVARVLLCDAFYAAQNAACSSVATELVVGTLRSLGLQPDRKLPFALVAAEWAKTSCRRPMSSWPGGRAGSTRPRSSRATIRRAADAR
jgi:hypothetical protein